MTPQARAKIIDGCSGGLSWIYTLLTGRDVPCRYCCDEHDLAYEEGGTSADRALADARLRMCVREAGYPVAAWVMWACVRMAGFIFWSD